MIDGDGKIVWMISALAQRRDGFTNILGHWPLSREAVSAAEAKGLGLEWLGEHKPYSEGWYMYDVNVCPVFTNDANRLKAEGKPTQ